LGKDLVKSYNKAYDKTYGPNFMTVAHAAINAEADIQVKNPSMHQGNSAAQSSSNAQQSQENANMSMIEKQFLKNFNAVKPVPMNEYGKFFANQVSEMLQEAKQAGKTKHEPMQMKPEQKVEQQQHKHKHKSSSKGSGMSM